MIKDLLARGIGFNPGGVGFAVRLGLSAGFAPVPSSHGTIPFTGVDMSVKVYTDYYAQQMLLNLIASAPVATGLLNGAKAGLFQGAPVLNNLTTYADLQASGILPTYTGYAAKTITWDAAVVRLSSGLLAVHGEVASPFAPTDGVTPNTITGMYVFSGSGNHLYWAELFDLAVPFIDAFSFISPDFYGGAPLTGGVDLIGSS